MLLFHLIFFSSSELQLDEGSSDCNSQLPVIGFRTNLFAEIYIYIYIFKKYSSTYLHCGWLKIPMRIRALIITQTDVFLWYILY